MANVLVRNEKDAARDEELLILGYGDDDEDDWDDDDDDWDDDDDEWEEDDADGVDDEEL